MVELFRHGSFFLNSPMGSQLIPTHVGRGLRPEIIVRQFLPTVRTYLESTPAEFWVPAQTEIGLKLLKGFKSRSDLKPKNALTSRNLPA